MPQHLTTDPVSRLLTGQPARMTLFVGAYGSGKSEVSVNFALWLARTVRKPGQRIVLCDLDTINPYYRSADARQILEANDIELIAPQYANTNVDVPAVLPGIFKVFDNEDILAVLDIGGEDLGARVVGSLRDRLAGQDFAINLVVNPYRPATDTPEGIMDTADALTATTGLPMGGLIDNANLLTQDNQKQLADSFQTVLAASELTRLPLLFAATLAEPAQVRSALEAQIGIDAEPQIKATLAQLAILPMIRTIHYPTDPYANT